MDFRTIPEKKYRLHNGEHGTEYEAVLECIAVCKRKQQEIEDRLEELQRQLDIAEGHP